MELTLNGRFLLGVPYQDQLYFDFSVSILTMGGECAALDVIADLALDPESKDSADAMLVELAYIAQQLEIDGIPKTTLTPQFLLKHLATDDYLLVMDLVAALRKKRQDAGECLNPATSG